MCLMKCREGTQPLLPCPPSKPPCHSLLPKIRPPAVHRGLLST
uniref:Uncharacterized protein n=1 Tax=Arundo donax TaxID=35708 RepID=A0A0A9AS45_ARUDO